MKRVSYFIVKDSQEISVRGYELKFPAPGRWAVRRIERREWRVDNLDTGCWIAEGETMKEAIDSALSQWNKRGAKEFARHIERQKRRRKRFGLSRTANLEAA